MRCALGSMPARHDVDGAGPDRLGLVGRQQYETVLWRLADAQVEPLYSAPAGTAEGGSAGAGGAGGGDGNSLWGCGPEQAALLDPGAGGKLPPERAHRKRLQIETLVRLVQALLPAGASRPHVVDFCGGSGHTALVIAAAVPDAQVTIVDFNSTALRLAAERAAQLGLSNVATHCGDVAAFSGEFSVGLALHACGAATDMALARCRESGAAFVVSPCCVGKIAKQGGPRPNGAAAPDGSAAPQGELALPRSRLFGSLLSVDDYVSLAAAADFHSVEHPAPRRRAAKAMIELDRAAAMHERGYCVRLGKLPPEARSPKDDIIWGWPATSAASSQLVQRWCRSAPAEEFASCGFNLLHEGRDKSPADEPKHASARLALQLLTPDATVAERNDLMARLRPLLPGGCGSASGDDEATTNMEAQIVSTVPNSSNSGDGGGAAGTADARKRRKAERRAARLARQRPKLDAAAESGALAHEVPDDTGVALPAADRQPKHFQGRNERRLLHELCHALLLRHWTADYPPSIGLRGSCVLASQPPCWPYIWDTGIHAAGPLVEGIAAPFIVQLPLGAQLAWQVRSGWLSPRVCLLTEDELAACKENDNLAAGDVLKDLQATVAVELKATATALEQLSSLSAPSVIRCTVPQSQPVAAAAERGESIPGSTGAGTSTTSGGGPYPCDGCVSGAVRRRGLDAAWIVHQIPVSWCAGAAWREARGLPPLQFAIQVGLQRQC